MLCVQVMDFRNGFVGLCYNPKMVCFRTQEEVGFGGKRVF